MFEKLLPARIDVRQYLSEMQRAFNVLSSTYVPEILDNEVLFFTGIGF